MSTPTNSTQRLAEAIDHPYQPPSPWRKLIGWNAVGLAILAAAVGVSLISLLNLRTQRYDASGNKKVVRVLHWQLELGFRQALQKIIDQYNTMKAKEYADGKIPAPIEVVQMGVTEKVYAQFVNTNLIAGTAPDLIQMGRGRSSGQYKAQYFLQYGDVIEKPNPYNAAQYLTDPGLSPELRAAYPVLAWRDTFAEGMRNGWDSQLQAFYGVPTTCFMANRISYNADLLKAATGSDEPPRTMGELLEVCRKLKAYDKSIIPIAGSRYNSNFWRGYAVSFTAESQDVLDTDLNGEITDIEGWAGLGSGKIALTDRNYRELVEAVTAISDNFSPGFLAMERETASFLFIQGKAAMHFTGSWDAGTLARQVPFRLGIMRMPLPGAGEKWSDPPKAPINEAGGVGAATFGIPKSSPVVAEAIDFLHYWTSQPVNQQVNNDSDWLPAVIGCTPSDVMKPFMPSTIGVGGNAGWAPGNEGQQVTTLFEGQILKILSGETTFDGMTREVSAMFDADTYGWKAIWAKSHDTFKITTRQNQRAFAGRLLHDHLLPAQGERNARLTMAAWATAFNGEDRHLLFNKTMAPSGKKFPEVER